MLDMTEVKDLELGRLFWIIRVAQYDHRVLQRGDSFLAAENQREMAVEEGCDAPLLVLKWSGLSTDQEMSLELGVQGNGSSPKASTRNAV